MNKNSKPNIVFIFSDQQHWRAVGHHDGFFSTPHIDSFAQHAVTLDCAFCTTPQCSPSRSSLLTGNYPSRTGVLGNIGAAGGEPLRSPTIGSVLQQAGYRTAYFGKWHLGKDATATQGWDIDLGVTGEETTDDALTLDAATQFLHATRRGGAQPFALFVSINDPHDVYAWHRFAGDVPETVPLPATCRPGALDDKPECHRTFMQEDQGRTIDIGSPAQWRRYRACYRQKVANFDRAVGAVLAALQDAGQWSQSLVVVTSDHGDMDTHHGLIFKGPFLYEQMIRVPAYVKLPDSMSAVGVPTRTSAMTVNADWVPTLVEAAGAEPSDCDGISLLPLLRGQVRSHRPFVVCEYYGKQNWVNPIRCIRTEDSKLVRYASGESEFYDLRVDPGESINRAGDSAHAGRVARLSELLEQWMRQRDDPFEQQRPTDRSGIPLGPGR